MHFGLAGWVLTRRRGGTEEDAEKKRRAQGKDRNSRGRRAAGGGASGGKVSELRSDAQGGALCHQAGGGLHNFFEGSGDLLPGEVGGDHSGGGLGEAGAGVGGAVGGRGL